MDGVPLVAVLTHYLLTPAIHGYSRRDELVFVLRRGMTMAGACTESFDASINPGVST